MAAVPEETVTTVGDRVLLTDKKKGEVAFVGPIAGKKGTFYGILLDEATGKNNGSVNKVPYFKAKDKYGVFVLKEKIKKSKAGPNNGDAPRVTVGSRVNVASKKSEGTVMMIGTTSFKAGPIWYGVKLDSANGKNNGTVAGRKYFTCKAKFGTFVPAGKFEVLSGSEAAPAKDTPVTKGHKKGKSKSSKKKKEEPKKKAKKVELVLEVGDRIMIKPDKKGEIRWMGEEKAFGTSIWYGVRLSEKRGDCDGEYKDVRKFNCPEGWGVYVQKKLIIKKLDESEIDFDYSDEEAKIQEIKDGKEAEIKAIKDKKREIKRHFRMADKDGDADIDRKEWKKMCNELWPSMAEEESSALFKSIDVSNSGEISFAEFDAYSGLAALLDRIEINKDKKEVVEKDNEDKKDDCTEDDKDDTTTTTTTTTEKTDDTEDTTVVSNDNTDADAPPDAVDAPVDDSVPPKDEADDGADDKAPAVADDKEDAPADITTDDKVDKTDAADADAGGDDAVDATTDNKDDTGGGDGDADAGVDDDVDTNCDADFDDDNDAPDAPGPDADANADAPDADDKADAPANDDASDDAGDAPADAPVDDAPPADAPADAPADDAGGDDAADKADE